MTPADLKWRAQDLHSAYLNAYHEPDKLAVLMEAMRDLWNEAVEEMAKHFDQFTFGPYGHPSDAIRAKRLPDSE